MRQTYPISRLVIPQRDKTNRLVLYSSMATLILGFWAGTGLLEDYSQKLLSQLQATLSGHSIQLTSTAYRRKRH